jgi:pimeloyl-ACP methyl ester carboxylesterase
MIESMPVPPLFGQMIHVGTHNLHLHYCGHGQPTVILDTGLGDWSLSLRDLQQRVAAFAQVVIYDRAGYGWSEPSPHPRTSQQLADELYALVCNAELPAPYLLVGHSLAGWHLRLFAQQQRDCVAGMVLIDATPPNFHPRLEQLDPGFTAGAEAALREHQAMAQRARDGQLQVTEVEAFGVPPFLTAAQRAAFFHLTLQPTYWETLLAEWVAEEESRSQVQRVTTLGDLPLTLLAATPGEGFSDHFRQLWVEEQRQQTSLSTRSEFVLLAGGHHIHWEQPEVVVTAIRRRVSEIMAQNSTHR